MARLAPGELPPSQDHGAGLLGTTLVVGAVLAALVGLRLYLGAAPADLSEGAFDVPVPPRLLLLRPGDEEWLEGWELVEGPRTVEGVPAALDALPADLSLDPRRLEDVTEVVVARYLDPAGAEVHGVALRYGALERAPEAGPGVIRQDDVWLLTYRGDGAPSGALRDALRQKAPRMKKVRVWAEKMRTLGNAYVQFGLDVVLGLLAGALLLFFTKYLLIVRNTGGP